MAEINLQHVRVPGATVYCGGQAHGFRPNEPMLLPAAHVEALREAGHAVEAYDPNASPVAAANAGG